MIATTNMLLSPLFATPSASMSWAIVIFCVVLGLLVALRPPKRTIEIKRPHE